MNFIKLAALCVVSTLVVSTRSQAKTFNKITSKLHKESLLLDSLKGKSLEKDTVLKVVEINNDFYPRGNNFSIIKDGFLNNNHQPNLINGLLGKVSGALVHSLGSAPGGAAFIKLRGADGIGGFENYQPLFIIDGIQVDNNTSFIGASPNNDGNKTVSNRLVDINPNDIAEIEVLKPGAATAIYGNRGANGVILIHTKNGEQGKLHINLSSDLGMDDISNVPKLQQIYTNGFREYSLTTSQAWGPTFAEAKASNSAISDILYNNFNSAFEKGFYNKNMFSISGGNDWGKFYSSISNLAQDGVVPNTSFKNNTARINGEITAIQKVVFSLNLAVNQSGGDRYNGGMFTKDVFKFPRNSNIMNYLNNDGTQNFIGIDNPLFGTATNKFNDENKRLIGSVGINYKPTNWLSFVYRAGYDTYTDRRLYRAPGQYNQNNNYIIDMEL